MSYFAASNSGGRSLGTLVAAEFPADISALNVQLVGLLLAGMASSVVVVFLVRRWAIARQRLEPVNERSSHTAPTPGFGGLGIVVPWLAYAAWLQLSGAALAADNFLLALLVGSTAVAAISLADDLWQLPSWPRLIAHLAFSAWLLHALLPEMPVPILLLSSVALAWFVNLYNFMDGIDGIAALQCLTAVLSLQWLAGGVLGYPGELLWLLAAVTAGFLWFNAAPASIFMGDVGSAFLGFTLGALSVAVVVDGQVAWFVPLILTAGFWVDATLTLARRVLSGQPFTQAHRSHLYQRLSDIWGHAKTSAGYAGYSLLWLLPLAWLASENLVPWSLALAGACLPLLIGWKLLEAGLPEER